MICPSTKFTNKLVLGGAQLGSNYGVTNNEGRRRTSEAMEILELAWESGIRTFDTAPIYGSEQILGEFIARNNLFAGVRVCTKIPKITKLDDHRKQILESISRSKENLGLNQIFTLFFHHSPDARLLLSDPEFFSELVENQSTCKIGISLYEPCELELLRPYRSERAVQFPLSVVNRAFEYETFGRTTSFARSMFLQGVLLSGTTLDQRAPAALHKFRASYLGILSTKNISPLTYALSYVRSKKTVDYFIFGVASKCQLTEVVNAGDCDFVELPEVNKLFLEYEKTLFDPRRWY
jgi:aryl-alcohol dehydrogenase-like predicted oxidoreductase